MKGFNWLAIPMLVVGIIVLGILIGRLVTEPMRSEGQDEPEVAPRGAGVVRFADTDRIVRRACDGPHLVYVSVGHIEASSIFVVPNDPRCEQ